MGDHSSMMTAELIDLFHDDSDDESSTVPDRAMIPLKVEEGAHNGNGDDTNPTQRSDADDDDVTMRDASEQDGQSKEKNHHHNDRNIGGQGDSRRSGKANGTGKEAPRVTTQGMAQEPQTAQAVDVDGNGNARLQAPQQPEINVCDKRELTRSLRFGTLKLSKAHTKDLPKHLFSESLGSDFVPVLWPCLLLTKSRLDSRDAQRFALLLGKDHESVRDQISTMIGHDEYKEIAVFLGCSWEGMNCDNRIADGRSGYFSRAHKQRQQFFSLARQLGVTELGTLVNFLESLFDPPTETTQTQQQPVSMDTDATVEVDAAAIHQKTVADMTQNAMDDTVSERSRKRKLASRMAVATKNQLESGVNSKSIGLAKNRTDSSRANVEESGTIATNDSSHSAKSKNTPTVANGKTNPTSTLAHDLFVDEKEPEKVFEPGAELPANTSAQHNSNEKKKEQESDDLLFGMDDVDMPLDSLFTNDPYLTPMEMEMLFLGEESMYLLCDEKVGDEYDGEPVKLDDNCENFQYTFIWKFASAAASGFTPSTLLGRNHQHPNNNISKGTDPSLVTTFRIRSAGDRLRNHLRLGLQNGYRRPLMRKYLATLRIKRMRRDQEKLRGSPGDPGVVETSSGRKNTGDTMATQNSESVQALRPEQQAATVQQQMPHSAPPRSLSPVAQSPISERVSNHLFQTLDKSKWKKPPPSTPPFHSPVSFVSSASSIPPPPPAYPPPPLDA
eukprot:CAMPEP_0168719224 /NCGR_PEP_ID=MMETSP0724-20121128/925_1 /TAXON_ID=265536 /ORGANISM="Amphiprora sp., Strain CCMP467" /LENGTH=726 /DNA_ID=CAMNT_0008765765 /DNA_START=39 /DNA_END=2218 /DNA_ORIENTATION=+